MESEDEDAFRRDALAMFADAAIFAEIDGEEGNGSCSLVSAKEIFVTP